MNGTTLEDLESALIAGRWGSSANVLDHAIDWYARAGAQSVYVTSRQLHPIAHYSALLHHERDADDLLTPEAISARVPQRSARPLLDEWTFTDSDDDTTLTNILRERLSNCSIVEPTEAQRADLLDALELLEQVLPAASRDALSHVVRLVLTDDPERIGETMRDLPTVVILGPAAFVDRKALAESLFHEALHTKTVITERSAMIMREDVYERNEVIPIPWRDDDDDPVWPVSRSFLAFYVYAHLTVLWAKLWALDHSSRDLDQFRRVCFRAAYLSKQLHIQPLSSGLGEPRQAMVRWLDALRIPAFDLTAKAQKLVEVLGNGANTTAPVNVDVL